MRRFVQALVFITLALAGSAAHAQQWTVARITGSGWIQARDGASVAMAAGMTVPKGSSAVTGANTRALLVYAGDSMMMGPGTIVTIPDRPDAGLKATVLQRVGQIALSIEKRSAPHFSVETPLIAAVVKGTQFTVTVSRGHADVKVARGLVAVSALASGETAYVGPGQSAGVSAKSGTKLRVSGVKGAPQIVPGAPKQAVATAVAAPTTAPAEVVAPAKKVEDAVKKTEVDPAKKAKDDAKHTEKDAKESEKDGKGPKDGKDSKGGGGGDDNGGGGDDNGGGGGNKGDKGRGDKGGDKGGGGDGGGEN